MSPIIEHRFWGWKCTSFLTSSASFKDAFHDLFFETLTPKGTRPENNTHTRPLDRPFLPLGHRWNCTYLASHPLSHVIITAELTWMKRKRNRKSQNYLSPWLTSSRGFLELLTLIQSVFCHPLLCILGTCDYDIIIIITRTFFFYHHHTTHFNQTQKHTHPFDNVSNYKPWKLYPRFGREK